MSYRLKDEGYPFKKIYRGRDWVGRVYRDAATHLWHGKIGRIVTRGYTDDVRAFEDAAAQAMGFSGAAALHASNAAVRAANRGRRATARDRAGALHARKLHRADASA